MIYQAIDGLLAYTRNAALVAPEDEIYSRNRLLELLHLPSYQPGQPQPQSMPLEDLLQCLSGYALEQGLVPNSPAAIEQFETALMGIVTPWPSTIRAKFYEEYAKSPQAATAYFYAFCKNTNYIRRHRMQLDRRWKTQTPYGLLDITINLSKPEKDPRDIAAARLLPKSGYPACLLCMENEGYAGRIDHPARQNHRIIPVTMQGEEWGFQYSPYVYYNEHCILLNKQHIPMAIEQDTFRKLLDFVAQFPHYFIGSNADLPIVGGSILSHEHFQGGQYTFAMERAEIETSLCINGYEDAEAGIVHWPMSVLRITHEDRERLSSLAAKILAFWRAYSDAAAGIYSHSGDIPHNTITPIARKRGGQFQLDLVLRNNITTEQYPLGVFHPHAELHAIKKENIGLIEVMGLAVLPSRLLHEMELLADCLLKNKDIRADDTICKHADWVDGWRQKYPTITKDSVEPILQTEIGLTFSTVLEHAGVFKRNAQGQAAFLRFIDFLNEGKL